MSCHWILLTRWAWTRSTIRRCSPTTTPSPPTSTSSCRHRTRPAQSWGTKPKFSISAAWNTCLFFWRQKFGCHRLLLSIASPYFSARLQRSNDQWILFNDTNPEAFQKIIDFIYHKRPFKVRNGGLGSSFSFIKLVLEVLCLAVKFELPKLVKFCEDVVEKKITVTSANCQQV